MPSLLVRFPDGESEEIKVNKTKISIGRSSRNDICITDPFASRHHAEIRDEGSSYSLIDKGSANGTFCNGIKVMGTIPLTIGDLIQIGETRISLMADPLPSSSNEILLSDLHVPPEAELTLASNKNSSGIFSVLEEVSSSKNFNIKQTLVAQSVEKDSKQSLLDIVRSVSTTLLSDASLEDTLERIMDLVFEALPVEKGFLLLYPQWIPSENTSRRMKAKPTELVCQIARHRDPNKELVGEELKISRSITEKVINERISILTSDASHDPRFQEMRSVVINKIHSIMVVALSIGEKVMGILYAETPYVNRFSEDDLRVLTMIASVASIKIENARLVEERIEKKRMDDELKVANEIQQRLQPISPPRILNYDLIGNSFPCRGIGGDYYDFIHRKNGRTLLALGDVSGKGIGAALMMSSLHAALHAQAQTSLRPSQIVTEINKYIFASSPENKFLTLFCAELDPTTNQLFYSNAGHNLPILVSKEGNYTLLESGGLPIGITDDTTYETNLTIMNPGDILVIYSDGITDSVNKNDEEFGENRLIEVVCLYRNRTASQIRDRIDEAIDKFIGSSAPVDDTTLVIVKRNLE